jgi:hypothetical protein
MTQDLSRDLSRSLGRSVGIWDGDDRTPETVPGTTLHAWHRGDNITLTGAKVSTWQDLSGNSRDLTQGTDANRPTMGAINGVPALYFDGDASVHMDWAASWSGDIEIFIVLENEADPGIAGKTGLWNFGSTGAGTLYGHTDGVIYDGFGRTARPSTGNPTAPLDEPHVYNVIGAAGEWTSRINGALHYTDSTSTQGWQVGGHVLGETDGAANWYEGHIAEIIAYQGKLTDDQRHQVEAYLARRYAISMAGVDVPETITNLEAWWRADSGVTLNGTRVSDWLDKTGTHSLSQSDASNQPIYKSASGLFNAQPALKFDGVSEYLAGGGAALLTALESTTCSVFVVGRRVQASTSHDTLFSAGRNDAATNYTMLEIDSGSNDFLHRRNDGASGDDFSATSVGTETFTVCATYDGSFSQLYRDGATDGVAAAMTANPTGMDHVAVGARHRSTTDLYYEGEIVEVIVYDKTLSSDEVEQLHVYARDRYFDSPFYAYLGVTGEHWDAAQGVTIATGVSDWAGRAGRYTVSEATGSQQPAWSETSSRFADGFHIDFTRTSDQYLESTEANLLAVLSGGAHSVAFLADFEDDSVAQPVVSWGQNAAANNYEWMGFNSSDLPTFARRNTTNEEERSAIAMVPSETPIVVVLWDHDANTVTVRVNGEVVVDAASNGQDPTANAFRIGSIAWSSTGQSLNGKLRHVVVADYLWSSAEIAAVETEMGRYQHEMPAQMAALEAWFRGDQGLARDGNNLDAWAEADHSRPSATAYQFVQSTAAQRPQYLASGLNSLEGVDFDTASADQHFDGVDLSSLTAGEVFIVVKADDDPAPDFDSNALWDLGTSASNNYYPSTDGIIYDGTGSTTRRTVGDISAGALTTYRLINITSTSSEWTFRADGVQEFTTGTNTVGFSNNVRLGSFSGSQGFDGTVMELFVYSAAITDNQRYLLHEYVRTRYGLTDINLLAALGFEADFDASKGWDGNTWTDQISGYSVTEATNPPTASTYDGNASLLFDGSTNQLIGTDAGMLTLLQGDFTILYASSPTSPTPAEEAVFSWADGSVNDNYGFAGWSNAAADPQRWVRRNTSYVENSSSFNNPGAATYGAFIWNNAANTITIRAEGSETLAATANLQDPVPTRYGFGALLRQSITAYHSGHIARLAIYPGVLSGAGLALAESVFAEYV